MKVHSCPSQSNFLLKNLPTYLEDVDEEALSLLRTPPGEVIPGKGDVTLNSGRRMITLKVVNTSDRPVQELEHRAQARALHGPGTAQRPEPGPACGPGSGPGSRAAEAAELRYVAEEAEARSLPLSQLITAAQCT
ncbi:hypothetical protein HPB47_022188 [Ixodes persulcatus]|uniref:Uncharacterized protein n=1 Tax=Ixodes persulcatus TaxID=34615 RepID=A0AC60QAD8_IXOPE|nr:hypothetical protein HPB47_022188 [Ixodes persulcatus]